MINVEVVATPLKFKRNLLRRNFFTKVPFMDYKHPIESLAGFSVTKEDFDLLKFHKIFTDIEGALLDGERRRETPGERMLGCVNCAMWEAGNRPHLSPRDERCVGHGFADSWAILCYGLMASNRPADSEIPCLSVLNGKQPINLQCEVMEE